MKKLNKKQHNLYRRLSLLSELLLQTIEDLAVSNMLKNHNLAKAISEMGWRQLRTMLEYKTVWQGKNLVVIGRFEPSSKVCSNCGNHKKDLKLSDRNYECDKCGNSMDRDLNAAII